MQKFAAEGDESAEPVSSWVATCEGSRTGWQGRVVPDAQAWSGRSILYKASRKYSLVGRYEPLYSEPPRLNDVHGPMGIKCVIFCW